jgi:hypothetical protein
MLSFKNDLKRLIFFSYIGMELYKEMFEEVINRKISKAFIRKGVPSVGGGHTSAYSPLQF